mmetsp:Transcript_11733/g.25034  ORF Transcript_11733/g.25034 Transcript_11733/m.25034 type:complete len:217 (-) Transcript_11733:157-807(-)
MHVGGHLHRLQPRHVHRVTSLPRQLLTTLCVCGKRGCGDGGLGDPSRSHPLSLELRNLSGDAHRPRRVHAQDCEEVALVDLGLGLGGGGWLTDDVVHNLGCIEGGQCGGYDSLSAVLHTAEAAGKHLLGRARRENRRQDRPATAAAAWGCVDDGGGVLTVLDGPERDGDRVGGDLCVLHSATGCLSLCGCVWGGGGGCCRGRGGGECAEIVVVLIV